MRKVAFLFAMVAVLATSCSSDKVPLSLTEQMQVKTSELTAMSELCTVEYTITKMIKASDEAEWYQFGDRKILFSCKATLKAGVDLSMFSEKDVKIDETVKSIELKLPKAEILTFNIKPEDVNLVYEKVALTRFDFKAQERNMLIQQGEADIRKHIRDYGILQDAEQNTRRFFEMMLSPMGFTTINIQFV